jgi:ABC-type amino acid transport system permease subunit
LVLLTFAYYLLPLTGIDLPPFWGVVLVIAFYHAAFMNEVFRAGILSLPQAQWDAARSLGLLQIVILPQALRLAAPPLVSLCVSLNKATSLVSDHQPLCSGPLGSRDPGASARALPRHRSQRAPSTYLALA